MKDVIISKKVRKEEMLSHKDIVNIIGPTKIAWIFSRVDFVGRYNWAMSNIALNVAKELGLTGIKKSRKHAGMKFEIKQDWLCD